MKIIIIILIISILSFTQQTSCFGKQYDFSREYCCSNKKDYGVICNLNREECKFLTVLGKIINPHCNRKFS